MTFLTSKRKKEITFISGGLLLLAPGLHIAGYSSVREAVLIAATLIAVMPIGTKALQAVRMKTFSIELLVTLAVIGALVIGEYVESAVVTFLFLFGDYLEGRTLAKTRSALKKLTDLAPQEAVIVQGGTRLTVPVDEVAEGQRVVIRTGGKVPVDGQILTGQATLNEAAITGESVPVTKRIGESIFSGSIVDTGYIEIEAEKVGDDTTFAKIIELVEEAQESKSPTEKFLDRFAHFYTPAVVILAVLVYMFTRDVHLAITFLVIACPGALVIGAPVSSVAGIGNGAGRGVLIKGGEVMDRLAKVDTLVFDKTGTLTKGKPEVTEIRTFGEMEESELLRLVAEAETVSEHHLGQTIVKEAEARGMTLNREPARAEVMKGSGIRAEVGGYAIAAGNRKLMQREGIEVPREVSVYAESREKAGNTAIFTAVDGKIAGIFSVADRIREDAPAALEQMRRNGIEQIIMLTGDNRHTASLVAEALQLDDYQAELLPEDKVSFVKELQAAGHVVAMAGDGVNDAPAIATADIGLAMGEGGTDISMETADVVLMADKLLQLSHAHALAKKTVRNMKQNTVFAVGIVAVLLAGVLAGSVHLASGMFIHEASVLAVILNAMRLVRFNSNREVPRDQPRRGVDQQQQVSGCPVCTPSH